MPCLEGGKLSAVSLRQCDVVEPFEQAAFLQRINLEGMRTSVRSGDGLLRQVHFDTRAHLRMKIAAHRGNGLRRKPDRQQAVLEAIARKNVPEAWRDHRANAEGVERVDGALP